MTHRRGRGGCREQLRTVVLDDVTCLACRLATKAKSLRMAEDYERWRASDHLPSQAVPLRGL